MQALTAAFGIDSKNAVSGLASMEARSKTAAAKIMADFGNQALFIEREIIAMRKAGLATVEYEAELAALKIQMAALNVETNAATAATVASAQAQEASMFAGANWRTVFREIIVIFREIGRGNYARIPGSLSIVWQSLGNTFNSLSGILRPFTFILAGLALAGYKVISWSLESLRSQKALSTSTEELTGRYAALGRALENAATRAYEFKNWLNDLRVGNESVTEGVDEQISAMRERFALEQQLASERGQTPQQRAKAEIDEMKKERDLVRSEIDDLADRTERAGAIAQKKEQEANNPEVETHIAGLKAIQGSQEEIFKAVSAAFAAKFPTAGASLYTGVQHQGSGWYSEQSTPMDIKVGGKKLSISLHDSLSTILAISGQLSANEIKKKAADDAAKASAEELEKLTKARVDLDKKNSKYTQDIKLKEEFLPQIAVAARMTKESGMLTENQRTGAYISPGTVSIIDVTKSIHGELKAIHNTIKNPKKQETSSRSGETLDEIFGGRR